MPRVSIIMPYMPNRGAQLDKTLQSIARQNRNDVEVVLVPDVRPHPLFKWLNPAPLWNQAINRSVGEILILQSPECSHGLSDTIEKLCEVQEGQALFASVMALDRQGLNDHWYCHPEARREPWFFCGSILRKTLGNIRFNEKFTSYGGEDVDFAGQLQRAGINFIWREDIYVEHQWHEFTGGVGV